MNILVTGATGFIGGNLVRSALKKNMGVSVLVRPESDTSALKKLIPEENIVLFDRDVKLLASKLSALNIDVVVHLASLYIAEHTSSDVGALLESNVVYGAQLLEAMNVAEINKFINVGTTWQVYKEQPGIPVNLYAATKNSFECLLAYYNDSNLIKSISLRLFDTYGEEDTRKKLLQLLVERAITGECLDMSPGEQKVDILHVSDVCSAIENSIENFDNITHSGNPTYGVGTGEPLSLRELVGRVESVVGSIINVNWGGRSYRKREVMTPWSNYEFLPGWSPSVSLDEGISLVYKRSVDESR